MGEVVRRAVVLIVVLSFVSGRLVYEVVRGLSTEQGWLMVIQPTLQT